MKKLCLLVSLVMCCFLSAFFVACGDPTDETPATYTVTVSVNNAEYGSVNVTKVENVATNTAILIDGNKLTIGETEIVATPADATAQYTYVFVNWTAAESVTENILVTANFTAEKNEYDVTVSVNNSEYGSVNVAKLENVAKNTAISIDGNKLTIGETEIVATPADDTVQYAYAFVNWTAAESVTDDITIVANFSRTENEYTVTVSVNNGEYGSASVSSVENVVYGTPVVVDGNKLTIGESEVVATPADATEEYSYAFTGWTAEETVNGDITVIANFSRDLVEYTVRFDPDNGDDVILQTYHYNDIIVKPAEDPVKADKVFVGWGEVPETCTENATYTAVYSELPEFDLCYLQNSLVQGLTEIDLPAGDYDYSVVDDKIVSDDGVEIIVSISNGKIVPESALTSGNYTVSVIGANKDYANLNTTKTITFRVYNDASELVPQFNTPSAINSTVTLLNDVSDIDAFDGIEYFNAYRFDVTAGSAENQRIYFSGFTADTFKYLVMDIYVDDTNIGDTSNWYFAGAIANNMVTVDRYVFNKSTGALVSTAKNGNLDLDTWYTVVYVIDSATDLHIWHTWSGNPRGTAYFANVAFYDADYAAAAPATQAFSGNYLQNTLVSGATSIALPSTDYTYTVVASDNTASISEGNINFANPLSSGNYSITLNAISTVDTGVAILNSLYSDVTKTITYRVYNNASELVPEFTTPSAVNSAVTQLSDVSDIAAFNGIEYFNAYRLDAKAGVADGQRIYFTGFTSGTFKYLTMDIYVDDTNNGDTSNWYFAGTTGYNLTTVDRYVFNKSTGALVSTAKNGILDLDTWYTVVYVLDNATNLHIWHTWSGNPTGTAYFANVAFYDKDYTLGGKAGVSNGMTIPTTNVRIYDDRIVYDVAGTNNPLSTLQMSGFGTLDSTNYAYLEFNFCLISYESEDKSYGIGDAYYSDKAPVVCTLYHTSVSATPTSYYEMGSSTPICTLSTNNSIPGGNKLYYGTWYHVKVALNGCTSNLYITLNNGTDSNKTQSIHFVVADAHLSN